MKKLEDKAISLEKKNDEKAIALEKKNDEKALALEAVTNNRMLRMMGFTIFSSIITLSLTPSSIVYLFLAKLFSAFFLLFPHNV